MGIQAILPISVDFCNKKYILVNAKQYDRDSRFLLVSCYNGGTYFPLSKGLHGAYIRYKKADGLSVLNSCDIKDGKILVELTEKMLSVQGTCVADLVIVSGSVANVNSSGQITGFSGGSIISTMIFHINVTENPVENWQIKEDYKDEFDELNDLFTRAEAHYENVVTAALSWTEGGTGTRQGENTDNAKYYSEQAKGYRDNAETIKDDMLTSQSNAITEINRLLQENIGLRDEALDIKNDVFDIKSETETLSQNAEISASNAAISADEANSSASDAYNSAYEASVSANSAMLDASDASDSAKSASDSKDAAAISEFNAQAYMDESKTSENNAFNYANKAQSYAVGGTGTRQDEDVNNAYYYYEMTKTVIEGLQGGYMPMGTISFSELATVEKATGYVYNMREDFVTDESFREGAGKFYTAGVNVYFTANNEWDCLGGAASPTATVSEVKDYLGI